ncbi:MAG TPA: TAXI family TRAP transporter solute-binding subunit, partial [Candidatus Methylomirabilis sp.]|nr:TAXI family TRAP transporter solute-binding subunit [Candidatus Methylomirabilis sp.]
AVTGARYSQVLAADKVRLEVVHTAGSVENLGLLQSTKDGADVAFVQGGIGDPDSQPSLRSLGSLFYEPLWVFVRAEVPARRLADLRRRRLAVGPEGSGTRALALELLRANRIPDNPTLWLPLGGAEAVEALLRGSVVAAFFVTAKPLPTLEPLIRSPAIRLMDFDQADAYLRRFRYLAKVTLPAGLLSFAPDIPPRSITLLAPPATLVARSDLHPAIVDLLLGAATAVQGPGQLFEGPGQFPSAQHVSFPLSEDAERYLRRGPTFLRRHLPFWVATFVERMLVLLIPVITLLIPIMRIAPPVYRWQVRSKIIRWYRDLHDIEERTRRAVRPEEQEESRRRLAEVEQQVGQVVVPANYADSLYQLRLHIQFVKQLMG